MVRRMDPKEFYEDRWNADDHAGGPPTYQRDWFHRFVLDPIFDPTANPRPDVALTLLQGGERVLDMGCYDGGFLERIKEAGLYSELCGVDIVADGVERAKQRGIRAEVVDLKKGKFNKNVDVVRKARLTIGDAGERTDDCVFEIQAL